MGILIPTQTLTGPQNPLMGAATGLFQGLAQGIPIAEQIRRRKEESKRQDQELALAQQQVGRKNAREDASKRAAQALLRASMMNAGAPSNGFGPSSPPGATAGSGAPALPNEIGPGTAGGTITGPVEHPDYTGEGPSPNPQQQSTGNPGTDWLAQEMQSGSLQDLSPEDADRIIEAHTRDLHLNAITQHAGRISNTIQRGLDKGAYDAVDADGTPDPTARIEMENYQRRIQSLDRTDPRAAAALLDEAEKFEKDARQYKSAKEKAFLGRQRKIQSATDEIAQIGAQGVPTERDHRRMDEIQGLVSDLNNGNITEEQFNAKLPAARAGTLQIEQEMAQAKLAKEQAEAQLAGAHALYFAMGGREGSPGSFRGSEAGMAAEHGYRMEEQAAAREGKPAREWSPNDIAQAEKEIDARVDKEKPELGGGFMGIGGASDEEIQQRKQERENLRASYEQQYNIPTRGRSSTPKSGKAPAQQPQTSKGGDSASAILSDKKATKAQKIARAKALGFNSYAEVEAAAKAGK